MGLKETAETMASKMISGINQPKHTKESDFEKLMKEHRKLCQSAMDLNAQTLRDLAEMAKAGVLGSEFRPIMNYSSNAYKATEELRIMGDDMVQEYRLAMSQAIAEIEKKEKKTKESKELAGEIEETIKKRIGVRGDDS
jgi:hypothetical protein